MARIQCGAKRRNGDICTQVVCRGRNRCRFHGGLTLVGPASGSYVSGRYSRYLPTRMAAKYREAEHDPDLLSLREEVKALDARIGDVLTRVDTGESGAVWARLQEAYQEFRVARAAGNTPANVQKMQLALARMEEQIGAGVRDWQAWEHVVKLWEERRKLVDTEVKISLARKYYISHTEGMVMMRQMADAVIKHAQALLPLDLSRKFLTAVTVDLHQIATRETGRLPVYGVADDGDDAR